MESFYNKIKHSPSAAAAFVFSFVLILAEIIFFHRGENDFRQMLAEPRDFLLAAFSFGVLFFFTYSMLVSRFGWRCVYFGVFAFALSVEYGFNGALGRFTLPTDFENALYASDASDKFGAITLFFSWLVIVPLAAYRFLFRFSPDNAEFGARLFAVNILLILAGFAAAADFQRPLSQVNAFAAHFNNLSVSALYFGEMKRTPKTREKVEPLETAAPQNNIVFIVDESVRADHLSVNGYARPTTPTLERLARENLLRNWKSSASGATESVGSNRLLLTGLNELPDVEGRIYTLPTIFQYARAAGYKTFYFDGQNYSEWIGSKTDRAEFGQIYTSDDFPETAPHDLDRVFAERVKTITSSSKGNFIWINKRGVHFRYEKNYPSENENWQPTDLAADRAELAADFPLTNNYDNAVLYNSESFFSTLFSEDLAENTVFIYTSDHGQTLIQDRASHAGESKPEALVPLLIIGIDARLRLADTNYAASHKNIFPTLLDFMNFPKERRAFPYAHSLLDAKAHKSEEPRTYFVGKLSGEFGAKAINFDEPQQ